MSLAIGQQIYNLIEKANDVLVIFKKGAGLDTAASSLALASILKKLEKQVSIASDDFRPLEKLSFLPNNAAIQPSLLVLKKFIISVDASKTKFGNLSYDIKNDNLKIFITPQEGCFSPEDVRFINSRYNFDLVFCLNTPDLESLGLIYEKNTEFFYEVPIVNIDYEPNNEHYGTINLVELVAGSSAETIYSLIESYNKNLIDDDIATCLLTDIISKTNNFRSLQITPNTLILASRLISLGARREEIVNNLYRTKSIAVLKLWGLVLARLKKFNQESKIIWSTLTWQDFEKTGTNEKDLIGVTDDLIATIPEAEIVVLIYETKEKEISAKIKSFNKNADLLKLAREFKPEGDSAEIHFLIANKNMAEAEEKIIQELTQKLKETNRSF